MTISRFRLLTLLSLTLLTACSPLRTFNAVIPKDRGTAQVGRDHAVHVAIAPGQLAKAIQVEAARLAGMSAAPPPPAAAPRRKGPPKGGPD